MARIPVDETNSEPDVCIIELGGTVGDIESAPFVEALRQLKRRAGKNNFLQIHVSLVPVINGEQKTKPTQAAIKDVRSAGLAPDLIACRCQQPLTKSTIKKIALFCDVLDQQVLAVHDVNSTYHVPLLLDNQDLIGLLSETLQLDKLEVLPALLEKGQRTWTHWKQLTLAQDRLFDQVSIALVGKYTDLHDSYLSVIKSLEHSAMRCGRKLNLIWVEAEALETQMSTQDPAKYHKAWHDVCTAKYVFLKILPGSFKLIFWKRCSCSWRFWCSRYRGNDCRSQVGSYQQYPLPWNLSWYADCRH